MNSILYQRWWTWRRVLGVVATCVAIFLVFLITPRVFASKSEILQNGERLLTIYDRGVEQSFVTKATTVGSALKEAGLSLESTDRVEPGRDEQLVADSYTINIYRARPVIVVDGSLRKTILTASQSPEQIAKDAGLTLYPEDTTAIVQSQDIVGTGAPLEFRISRAKTIELTLYGDILQMRTQAKTVQDMLRNKGIVLKESDRVSVPLNTPIRDGLQLRVWREGKQTVTRDEDVNFEVEKIQDANRPVGYREVKTPGEKGVRSVTYEVTIRDGKEVDRKEIASATKTPAKKQVEIIGAKVAAITGTCGEWMAAAGVANTSSANYLIGKESGCNPRSLNRSSGACGIGQALPCGKMGAVNPDGTSAVSPVDQMRWMNSYVMGRYGSWDAAAAHHRARGWY